MRSAARQTHDRLYESYDEVLAKSVRTIEDHFDIFLSHSIKDAEIVRGAHILLQRLGHSVYVDWIIDRDLNREEVSRDTAIRLKKRMRQCDSLLYLATENASRSKWMPWELGFFDGYSNGRVAILPIMKNQEDEYDGQEYLGIYPYADIELAKNTQRDALWVNRSISRYGSFGDWLREGNRAITTR